MPNNHWLDAATYRRQHPVVQCQGLRVIALTLALATSLGGCAINPYIENTRPVSPVNDQRPGSLELALKYADDTYDAYRGKLLAEFEHRRNLNTGLVGLAAAAIGFAVFDAHSDALKATALVGGTTYTLGTWNSSEDRLGLYVEGMKAIACAKLAITPLRNVREKRYEIVKHADGLSSAIDKASSAIGDVTAHMALVSLYKDGERSPLIGNAQSELAASGEDMKHALDMLGMASGLVTRGDEAGNLLYEKVTEIKGKIDAATKGTLASINLPQAISNLYEATNLLVPGIGFRTTMQNKVTGLVDAGDKAPKITAESGAAPGTKVPVASLAQALQILAVSLGKLRETRYSLLARMAALQGVLAPVDQASIKNELAGCGVEATKLSPSISLDRNQINLTGGVAIRKLITIRGGTQPYSGALMDSPATGITANLIPGSNVVEVIATAETVAGESYRYTVSDAAGHVADLTISVVAKEAPANITATTKPDCYLDGWNSMPKDEICLFQRVFKTEVTGIFGDRTCQAMKGVLGDKFKGGVNDAIRKEVRLRAELPGDDITANVEAIKKANWGCETSAPAVTPPPAAATGTTAGEEIETNVGILKSIREWLNNKHGANLDVAAEGLDEPLRNALQAYQRKYNANRGEKPPLNEDGKLTADTWKALQRAMTPD